MRSQPADYQQARKLCCLTGGLQLSSWLLPTDAQSRVRTYHNLEHAEIRGGKGNQAHAVRAREGDNRQQSHETEACCEPSDSIRKRTRHVVEKLTSVTLRDLSLSLAKRPLFKWSLFSVKLNSFSFRRVPRTPALRMNALGHQSLIMYWMNSRACLCRHDEHDVRTEEGLHMANRPPVRGFECG